MALTTPSSWTCLFLRKRVSGIIWILGEATLFFCGTTLRGFVDTCPLLTDSCLVCEVHVKNDHYDIMYALSKMSTHMVEMVWADYNACCLMLLAADRLIDWVKVFAARHNARIASAVLATAIPSVCPSVCPSVTRRYCVKMTARSIVQFALLDSKICLVL